MYGVCRFCETKITDSVVDLGMSPLSNSYLEAADLNKQESFYPLHLAICRNCFLIQLGEFESPSCIFSNYAYFSSYSSMWLEHSKKYAQEISERLALAEKSLVVEIASNDGYLLQYFKEKKIPVLGIEPAANVAAVAIDKGIETIIDFFDSRLADNLAKKSIRADLLIGNNVLAHVPNINEFVRGIKILLNPHGTVTMEFPHLIQLLKNLQFDTVYHEHFSYFSFFTVEKIFNSHGLTIFDVQELDTHGGSLRIFAKHADDETRMESSNVSALREKEKTFNVSSIVTYSDFAVKVLKLKRDILSFFIQCKNDGKTVVGYGAPAKGNTLLNFCGIMTDFVDYTVDRNPFKQGKFLPGTHIPVKNPEEIFRTRPDYVVILPWNLKREIMSQMDGIRDWDGKFVTLIPSVEVF